MAPQNHPPNLGANPKRCTSHQNMLRPNNEEDKYMRFSSPHKYDVNSQGIDPSKEVKLNNMKSQVDMTSKYSFNHEKVYDMQSKNTISANAGGTFQ